MHTALASDSNDPAFAPETPSVEALGLLTATVDEEIERMFVDLPDDDERLAPILGRGEEVREQLRAAHARRLRREVDPDARRLPPRPDALGARTTG